MPLKLQARLFLLTTLLVALPLRGQEVTGDDATLTPYLTSTTLAIARLDVAQLDAGALKVWATAALAAASTDKRVLADGAAAIDSVHGPLKRWAEAFKKAGGRRVYAVV